MCARMMEEVYEKDLTLSSVTKAPGTALCLVSDIHASLPPFCEPRLSTPGRAA